MKLKKNQLKKQTNKNNLSKPRLTCQIHNPDHKTKTTQYKKIKINYETQFLINPVLKYEIKKNRLKKEQENDSSVNLSNL
jgi:hypothetical protein